MPARLGLADARLQLLLDDRDGDILIVLAILFARLPARQSLVPAVPTSQAPLVVNDRIIVTGVLEGGAARHCLTGIARIHRIVVHRIVIHRVVFAAIEPSRAGEFGARRAQRQAVPTVLHHRAHRHLPLVTILFHDEIGHLARWPIDDHMLDAPNFRPIGSEDPVIAVNFHLSHQYIPFRIDHSLHSRNRLIRLRPRYVRPVALEDEIILLTAAQQVREQEQ